MRRMKILVCFSTLTMLFFASTFSRTANCQTRDEQVLKDRDLLSENENWYYDDLDAAVLEAAKQKKPMMVVLRCIP